MGAGTFLEEVTRAFLGGGPQLVSTEYIHSPSERYRLRTIPAGTVGINLYRRIILMQELSLNNCLNIK